jgi:outer membrane protein assembly factor BamA
MARAIPWLPLIALMGLLSVALEVQAQSAAPLDALDPRQGIAAALAPHAGKPVSTARLECDTDVCATRAVVLDPLVQMPPGAALDPATAAEAWSRLTRTELFRSVTPRVEPDPGSPDRVVLVFVCVAHALVTDVDIEYVGARSFWYPKQFEVEIKKRLLVHKGAPYLLDDPEVLERQRQSVLELYERQGYEGTEVLIVPALEGEEGAARKRVRVKVLIREGAQDLLGDVLLQGNASRPYARALAPVETGERADFWRDFFQFIGVGTYERRKFRDELREVERRYREEGYFSARVRLDGVLEERGRVYPMVRVF